VLAPHLLDGSNQGLRSGRLRAAERCGTSSCHRRASCVFRAILLGSSKPSGTDVMAEFYRDHIDDADMKGKVVLDPASPTRRRPAQLASSVAETTSFEEVVTE
jgi:hypothetical protein